jgi:hypothetical protein
VNKRESIPAAFAPKIQRHAFPREKSRIQIPVKILSKEPKVPKKQAIFITLLCPSYLENPGRTTAFGGGSLRGCFCSLFCSVVS